MPFPGLQPIETVDDFTRFAAFAAVGFNSLHEIVCPSVMEEKHALPDTPEGSCSELIGAGRTLCDTVRKIFPHVVDEQVGEEIHGPVGKRGARTRRRAAGNHPASGK